MAEVIGLPARVPGRAVERFLAAELLSPDARRSHPYCLGAGTAMFPHGLLTPLGRAEWVSRPVR